MELEALICLKVQEKKIAVQAVVSSTPLFTLDSLTPSNEAVQGAIAENVDTAHVNQALEELQHFVKGFLMAQMDAIVTQVPARIAELLQRVRAVRESLGSSAKVTDPKLMLEEVERLHDMTRGKVQGVVSGMVKMLNALMMPPSATSEDCNN